MKLLKASARYRAFTNARGPITDNEHAFTLEEMIALVTELVDTEISEDTATALTHDDHS
ncbi:hypothetical protein ACGFNU_47070 [Spirillospora sp. NPDC048911]|uniref:hypothetical protein n=1 Tax=Spirillospora sp. NPDC048911 TaxID=3364527 RepID=UPI003710990B